jgi:hypothetical protein
VRRSPTLDEAERVRLLAGLAAIEATVGVMVLVIDEMGGEPPKR